VNSDDGPEPHHAAAGERLGHDPAGQPIEHPDPVIVRRHRLEDQRLAFEGGGLDVEGHGDEGSMRAPESI